MEVRVLEMPLDFGASRHGADMGPSAIRLAGLKSAIEDQGHTIKKWFSPIEISPQEQYPVGSEKLRYLEHILSFCETLRREIVETVNDGDFPLIIGGDHSIALGSIAGAASAHKGKRIGVLYIDAHGDFNTTETSPSGNIHGMCLSASCGLGDSPLTNLGGFAPKVQSRDVAIVGARDLDSGEKKLLKENGVNVFSVTEIDRYGMGEVIRRLKKIFESCDLVHISLDLDVFDPLYAPGVGISVPYGLSPREVLFLLEEISNFQRICSAEVVELNPVLDTRSKTARLAVSAIGKILGHRIF